MMHRVQAKIEAEKDKKQASTGQKRAGPDDKSGTNRTPQRRRSSQQRAGSGATGILLSSPTAISPLTAGPPGPLHQLLPNGSSNVAGSPTATFTPANANGTGSFTPQSGNSSSPGGPEFVYPFALTGQGIYTPFGNSPPLFPVATQAAAHPMHIPAQLLDVKRGEDDNSGQFWQSLFGPSGSSLAPSQYQLQGLEQPFASSTTTTLQQGHSSGDGPPSPGQGEFKDPNDVNVDFAGGDMSMNFDDGLVDWSDFIAQCSQVWVTE